MTRRTGHRSVQDRRATKSTIVLQSVLAVAAASGIAATTARADGLGCEFVARDSSQLAVRDGYLDFIAPDALKPFKDALPQVANAEVAGILANPNTVWYDEASMVFLYQDSVESVTGGRANCVGRMVGERNADNPGIHKLVEYFGDDFRFKFPFRKAAGTDDVENVRVLNFWAPPRQNGRAMPVKWWQESSRGRWHWVFPVGTVLGEALYERDASGAWVPFEVRTRKRYLDGWSVDLFRPFTTADGLASAIKAKRPNWASDANLSAFVLHLTTRTNLTATQLASVAFSKVFPPIAGALDILPELADKALLSELLTTTPFQSTEGAIWKTDGHLETYAPASTADFGVVPKGYTMGMIPVNEVSCNRCHIETGHGLGDFEFEIILYGEVWGEDRIFTWHLFQPTEHIFDTWDDADGSREVNPRLMQSHLIQQGQPASNDPNYKQLPVPYPPPGLKAWRAAAWRG